MNYRVSTVFDRLRGKSAYTIECKGTIKECEVYASSHTNVKRGALLVIRKAIAHSKGYINHDDILNIEVQNSHLCKWLSGRAECKGYVDELDAVFQTLETLDCRYRFIFVDKPYAREILLKETKPSIKGSSLLDIINELEENNDA